MNGKLFLDTNVLVYCYAATEPDKQVTALKLSQAVDAWISTQVLQELSNILRKKFQKSWIEIENTVEEITRNFNVFSNQPDTVRFAVNLAGRYGYSFYDSLIVASALSVGCSELYSEDMQDGQLIENKLSIKNPFKGI